MEIAIWSLISIAGLCWGSFINVLIHRTQTGESIFYPPSKCPKCDVKLLWWHKIPLFSYFYLNGRCYFCNKIISIQYPTVEMLGLILFIFSFSVYKSIVDAFCVIGILSLFFTDSVLDFRIKKVSSLHCAIIAGLGILFNRYDLVNTIVGMLVGAVLILVIKELGKRFFEKEIFGTGDIFLFGALGSVVGIDKLFMYIFWVFVLQILLYLPTHWQDFKQSITSGAQTHIKIFIIACLFLYITKTRSFFAESFICTVFLGILLYSTYYIVKELFSSLKQSESGSYCPLAPAVALSCLLFLL